MNRITEKPRKWVLSRETGFWPNNLFGWTFIGLSVSRFIKGPVYLSIVDIPLSFIKF